MLVRMHDFKFTIGAETHLFVVEEIVAMLPSWPERFRLRLAAPVDCEIKVFYGATAEEAARKGAEFIASRMNTELANKISPSSSRRPGSSRQILLPQQIQESESE